MPDRSTDSRDGPDALHRPNRRRMLSWLGIAGAGALAGCGGDDDGGDGDGGDGTTGAPTTGDGTSTGGDGTTGDGSTTGGAQTPAVGGEFVEAFTSGANTVNWIFNAEGGADERIALTLDGAWAITNSGTTPSADDEVFPLWLSPETEDDQTFEITVRDGLQWGGDYGQMTADDWVYMYENLLLADENWSTYTNYGGFSGQAVERVDERTFEVTLPSADAVWPYRSPGGGGLWGMYCVPRGLLEPYVEQYRDGDPEGAAAGLEGDEELTSLSFTGNLGPYTLENWQQEAQFVAARNDEYYVRDAEGFPDRWADAPYFERVTHRVVTEESARLQALRNGEVDHVPLPPDQMAAFANRDDVDVYSVDDPYVRQVTFNMRENGWHPFRLKAVRQAMMTAVDKEAFVENVFRGHAEPAHTMQPNWSSWYDDSAVTEFGVGDSYSPTDAREMLASALDESAHDYAVDGDTVVDGDGNQVTLSLIARAGSSTEQTMAELLSSSLGEVGFDVEIERVPGTTFQQNYMANAVPEGEADRVPDDWPATPFNAGPRDVATSAEPWDMALVARFNTYPRTPASSSVFFHERAGVNYFGYVPSDGVDIRGLYEDASAASSDAERRELFAEVFGVISREVPFGIIMSERVTEGWRHGVEGPTEFFGAGWDDQTYFRT